MITRKRSTMNQCGRDIELSKATVFVINPNTLPSGQWHCLHENEPMQIQVVFSFVYELNNVSLSHHNDALH